MRGVAGIVRFAADERSGTTLAMLAECFEVLGGVPGKVLADRILPGTWSAMPRPT